jgi:hypothetical protein
MRGLAPGYFFARFAFLAFAADPRRAEKHFRHRASWRLMKLGARSCPFLPYSRKKAPRFCGFFRLPQKDNVKPRVTPPLKRNGTRPARKAGEGNARPAAPPA